MAMKLLAPPPRPAITPHDAHTWTQNTDIQPPTHTHPRHRATSCHHFLHPSAPSHAPLCPACTTAQASANLDLALKGLIAEGGLAPSDYMSDRRWQRAKLRYEVASKRAASARSRDQLRVEREQAWDEAHRLRPGDGAREECVVCAEERAGWVTSGPEMKVHRNEAWWERERKRTLIPSPTHTCIPQQSPPPPRPIPSFLRDLIHTSRLAHTALTAHRNAISSRHRTESALRRKHNLAATFFFEPAFWESPICACMCRANYERGVAEQRMVERRARGNVARARLGGSGLRWEVFASDGDGEDVCGKEEEERMERVAGKVSGEVGYLYLIGVRGWRDEWVRSNRQLVWRRRDAEVEWGFGHGSEEEEEEEEYGEEDDSDGEWEDEDDEYEDEELGYDGDEYELEEEGDGDGDGDVFDNDRMDIE